MLDRVAGRVPVGPEVSLRMETVQPQGGDTLYCVGGGRLVLLQIRELGYTEVSSVGQITVFTACLGILLFCERVQSIIVQHYATDPQFTCYFHLNSSTLTMSESTVKCGSTPAQSSTQTDRVASHRASNRSSIQTFNNRCRAVDTWQVATQDFTGWMNILYQSCAITAHTPV